MKYDISIIICCYNPEPKIFSRCLNAVKNLKQGSLKVEVIIVDNNSTPLISSHLYVQNFLSNFPEAKIVVENNQGLTFARKCGLKHSTGEILIFFDDDNEANGDYLLTTISSFAKNENVVIWGPGKVTVDYVDNAPIWVKKHFSSLFQKKHVSQIMYGCTVGYFDWTVNGTGMSIKRKILENFFEKFDNSTITDRKGESLTSGGDTQIVWYAVKNRLTSGVNPSLIINHMISKKRCSMKYILNLYYSLEKSYLPAFIEVFPEKRELVIPTSAVMDFLKCIWYGIRTRNYRLFLSNLSNIVGKHVSYEIILNKPTPMFIMLIKRLLNL